MFRRNAASMTMEQSVPEAAAYARENYPECNTFAQVRDTMRAAMEATIQLAREAEAVAAALLIQEEEEPVVEEVEEKIFSRISIDFGSLNFEWERAESTVLAVDTDHEEYGDSGVAERVISDAIFFGSLQVSPLREVLVSEEIDGDEVCGEKGIGDGGFHAMSALRSWDLGWLDKYKCALITANLFQPVRGTITEELVVTGYCIAGLAVVSLLLYARGVLNWCLSRSIESVFVIEPGAVQWRIRKSAVTGVGPAVYWSGAELQALSGYGEDILVMEIALSAVEAGKCISEMGQRVSDSAERDVLVAGIKEYMPGILIGMTGNTVDEVVTTMRVAVALSRDAVQLGSADVSARVLHMGFYGYSPPEWVYVYSPDYRHAVRVLSEADVVLWFARGGSDVPIDAIMSLVLPEVSLPVRTRRFRASVCALGGVFLRVHVMRENLRRGTFDIVKLRKACTRVNSVISGDEGFSDSELAGMMRACGIVVDVRVVYRLIGLLVYFRHKELGERVFSAVRELLSYLGLASDVLENNNAACGIIV